MAKEVPVETVFLREFARTYVSEISFTPEALADLARYQGAGYPTGLADVLYVFKHGTVTSNEKEDADGAHWVVEGRTCHDNLMSVSIKVWCDTYQMRVKRVILLGVMT